jgi:hypothetical protein
MPASAGLGDVKYFRIQNRKIDCHPLYLLIVIFFICHIVALFLSLDRIDFVR